MLIDYLIPTRIIRKNKYKNQIDKNAKALLPKPYNVDLKYLEQRNDEYFKKNNLDKDKVIKEKFGDKVYNAYFDRFPIFTGSEAAIFYGYDLFDSFSKIDSHFYEGMSNLAGTNLRNFSDLASKVESYSHSNLTGWSDALTNKVGGHVGEVFAADHLQNMGLHIDWPATSNNQGWDLLVNGHEINIKMVGDYYNLSQHFQLNPDIPVIIPGDAQHIPQTAIHFNSLHNINELMNILNSGKDHLVFVDDSLSNADIMNHTEAAGNATLGSPEMIHFHIPWITLAFSSWREIKLLTKKKTDLLSAAKNIGFDAAGTAGGGFLGAKAGAITGATLGSFIGPAGTAVGGAIGALVGGIGGAILGRTATNAIKKAPFENALNEFKLCEETLNKNVAELTNEANSQIEQCIKTEQDVLNLSYTQKNEYVFCLIDTLKGNCEKMKVIHPDEVNFLYVKSVDEITKTVNTLKKQKKNSIRSFIIPSIQEMSIDKAIKKLKKANKVIRNYTFKKRRSSYSRSDIYRLFSSYGFCGEYLVKSIKDMESERLVKEQMVRSKIENCYTELLSQRKIAMEKISFTITQITKKIQSKLNPLVNETKLKYEKAHKEAEKLGLA